MGLRLGEVVLVLAILLGICLGLQRPPPAPVQVSEGPTASDEEGPYYRPDAPFRDRLAPEGHPGDALVVQGRVTDVEGRAIAGAVLEVWHADPLGRYSMDDPGFAWRGRLRTDREGRFEVVTAMPGYAFVDTSRGLLSHPRPRHIHFRVRKRGYDTLTTQLYFASDPQADPQHCPDPERVVEVETGPTPRAFFNMRLQEQ